MDTKEKQHDAEARRRLPNARIPFWEKEGRPEGMAARHWSEAEMQIVMCHLHDVATNLQEENKP